MLCFLCVPEFGQVSEIDDLKANREERQRETSEISKRLSEQAMQFAETKDMLKKSDMTNGDLLKTNKDLNNTLKLLTEKITKAEELRLEAEGFKEGDLEALLTERQQLKNENELLKGKLRLQNAGDEKRVLLVGGSKKVPSKHVQKIPSLSQCQSPAQNMTLPLPVSLGGHVSISTGSGVLVCGGMNGGHHDARKCYFSSHDSPSWENFSSLNKPRKSACIELRGRKIIIRGGASTNPPWWVKASAEEFDLDDPDKGWQLKFHRITDRLISKSYICNDPAVVWTPC